VPVYPTAVNHAGEFRQQHFQHLLALGLQTQGNGHVHKADFPGDKNLPGPRVSPAAPFSYNDSSFNDLSADS